MLKNCVIRSDAVEIHGEDNYYRHNLNGPSCIKEDGFEEYSRRHYLYRKYGPVQFLMGGWSHSKYPNGEAYE